MDRSGAHPGRMPRRLEGQVFMNPVQLKRLGVFLVFAAIVAHFAQAGLPEEAGHWVRSGGIIGGVLLAAGFALEQIGARQKCVRCGRISEKGSAFCSTHRHELEDAATTARKLHQRDDRTW